MEEDIDMERTNSISQRIVHHRSDISVDKPRSYRVSNYRRSHKYSELPSMLDSPSRNTDSGLQVPLTKQGQA